MLRIAAALAALLLITPALGTEAGWALLREGGQVVLINNANAPGHGDPSNFDINNCATQRNLSARGRQQAKRMGALFFARAAPVEKVLTSRFCRSRDTAIFAFGEDLIEFYEPLDLLSADPEAAAAQMEETRDTILGYTGAGNLIVVTHDRNIMELTGITPRESEAVILSRGNDSIGVAARITFN